MIITLTLVIVMQASDMKAFWSFASELEPHRRHRGQLWPKNLSNVIPMGVPLWETREKKTDTFWNLTLTHKVVQFYQPFYNSISF